MTNAKVEDQYCQTDREQRRPLVLEDLPLEILLLIFDYCHAFDLVRLSAVCWRFYCITHDDLLWYKRRKLTLATNQVSKRFRSRCNPLVCPRTKWQVAHNWENGCYQKNVLFSQKIKLMPWIQLTEDVLWWSGGNQLRGYMRTDSFSAEKKIFQEHIRSDICKFVVKDNYIISGHRDGSLIFWLKDRCRSHYYCSIEGAHQKDIDAVDETGNLVISGGTEGVVKAWTSPIDDDISDEPITSVSVNDRIWSLSANPIGTKIAIGTSGTTGPPLYICDTINFNNFEAISHPWRQGAGILDMVWDDANTLLTCGYDTCIRKWDLRIGKCVNHWTDPTDATIYCISSDYNYTMVTGTQFNCKAVLWDQRKPKYVQLYFMNLQRMSSPIYSLSFDSTHLYGATDQNVVEVKFSGQPSIKKNFREIMNYKKVLIVEGQN